jgi:hypothetical protein
MPNAIVATTTYIERIKSSEVGEKGLNGLTKFGRD